MSDAQKRKKIQEAIKDLGGRGAYEIETGNVESIDEQNQCIDVKISDGVIRSKVRLKMALGGGDVGMYVLPKKDTYCSIAQMDGDVDYCMIQCAEIDKLWVKIGDTTFELTKDGAVFNGGNNKGMVITDKAVERWNKIEDDVNKMKDLLRTILTTTVNEPGNGAPSALQIAMNSAFASYYGDKLVKTKDTDVKNDKVKH